MFRSRGLLTVSGCLALTCVKLGALSDFRIPVPNYKIVGDNTDIHENWQPRGNVKVSKSEVILVEKNFSFGMIWKKEAVNSSNWELEVDFEIQRNQPTPSSHADGFALFYVRDREPGQTSGTKSHFVGLGIIFDTYRNSTPTRTQLPYLQSQVLNGGVPHLWKKDGVTSTLVNIHAPNIEKPNSKLGVKYRNNSLTVTLNYREGGDETDWIKEEFRVDNVYLPKGYYFGLGTSCGLFCCDHKIRHMKVFSLDGSDQPIEGLPKADPRDLFQNNEYVLWSRFDAETVSPSAVVLGLTAKTKPIFFARIVAGGRLVPAIYVPSLNREKMYVFANDRVTFIDRKDAQILSYRYSRGSHLLWQEYPTQRLESEEFRKRLVAVGYSTEGDTLNICRSIPPMIDY